MCCCFLCACVWLEKKVIYRERERLLRERRKKKVFVVYFEQLLAATAFYNIDLIHNKTSIASTQPTIPFNVFFKKKKRKNSNFVENGIAQ